MCLFDPPKRLQTAKSPESATLQRGVGSNVYTDNQQPLFTRVSFKLGLLMYIPFSRTSGLRSSLGLEQHLHCESFHMVVSNIFVFICLGLSCNRGIDAHRGDRRRMVCLPSQYTCTLQNLLHRLHILLCFARFTDGKHSKIHYSCLLPGAAMLCGSGPAS